MRDAKASLKGKWGLAALTTLVMGLIVGASGFIFIGPLLLTGPFTLGYISFLKSVKAKSEDARLERLFDGFSDFLRGFLGGLLVSIFVCLWMLLLVIPGIIMGYAYSMTFYILSDDKDISAMDAIRKSRAMMRGYKWKLFCLQLRFFGWLLLSMLTFGILLFWIQPYMDMATLNFYNDIKADYEARNGVKVEVEVTEVIIEEK